MNCSKCGRQITKGESFSHQGQTLCEDCYIEISSHAGKCDPWASYVATRTQETLAKKGTEVFTDLQKKVYEFIKSKGKVTREEVKESLKLSEAEMDAQLTPLMFSEMVKERGEAGKRFLVAVK